MGPLQRLIVYSREQLEPGSRLLLSFLTAFFIALILTDKYDKTLSILNIVVPGLSVFFLLAYYRVSDEFKDYETDKNYFPDRPVPSGKVLLADLKWLLYLFAALGVILNLLFSYALKEFIYALAFTLAMGKWFFMEEIISKNRMLAFFTHAPVGFFLYWYQVTYFSEILGIDLSVREILSICIFIVVPGFTWEILRKSYLPQNEIKGYQVYSTMLGFRGALTFANVWIVVTLINNFILVYHFPVLVPAKLWLLSLNLLLLIVIEIHSRRPLMPNLKKVAEIYMALQLLIPLALLLNVHYG